MENKRNHLGLIQEIISRMASNLFFLRGWTITLIAALFALFVKEINDNPNYIYIIYFPVLICWILDGYFLSQERLFRALYNHVRKLKENEIDFSMDTSQFKDEKGNNWLSSMYAPTLLIFYLPLLAIIITVTYLVFK